MHFHILITNFPVHMSKWNNVSITMETEHKTQQESENGDYMPQYLPHLIST